jgi:hypothetical protein
MKSTIQLLTATAIAFTSIAQALAQSNNFFGTSVPGQGDMTQPPPGANAAAGAMGSAGGNAEYTDDEKRMRKKYKANIVSTQKLIAKATAMIKAGEKSHDDKALKKGKILKDIGERRLAELRQNSPFLDMAGNPRPGTQ